MNRPWLPAAASTCLHAVAALALLAPWSPRPLPSSPPVVMELVMVQPPPPPSPSPSPASTSTSVPVPVSSPAPAPAPPKAKTPPAKTPRPRPTAIPLPQAAAPAATPTATTESPAPQAIATPDSATAGGQGPPDNGGGGGGGGGSAGSSGGPTSAPGYALGDAHTPLPDYPWSARRRGIEGRVVLRLEVDADGRPTAVQLVHGSGHEVLDKAAEIAVWHWRLRPALMRGQPVAGVVVVPIVFKLT